MGKRKRKQKSKKMKVNHFHEPSDDKGEEWIWQDGKRVQIKDLPAGTVHLDHTYDERWETCLTPQPKPKRKR